jgi:ribosomal protein S18 acetylase RimI-like enzyme
MKPAEKKQTRVATKVERVTEFKNTDINDICDAAESTVLDNSMSFSVGSNRSDPLIRERLEAYWKGVLLVPERQLIVGRVDGTISSSIQLVKPSPSNQTSNFCGYIEQHFVAPWARGHGLAKELLTVAEKEAKNCGLTVLQLKVRANLDAAIKLYESCGYKRWGTLDKYEMIGGQMMAGHFYYKDI